MEDETGCSLEDEVDVPKLVRDYQLYDCIARTRVFDVPQFEHELDRLGELRLASLGFEPVELLL